MSVENVAEFLPAYVCGELSGEDEERVEAALAESSGLRDEAARYERLFVLLVAAAAEEVETPAGLERRIMRRVAVRQYLSAAAGLFEGLVGAYGRALVYYLRLG